MNEEIVFHKNLQFLRRMNNVSRGKLAKELGISTMTLFNYEKNTTSPNVEVVSKISKIFKISLEKLIYEPLEERAVF